MTVQGLLEGKKNIFVPTGSGGTAAGIIIGNYLTGNTHQIFLLQVADTVEELRDVIIELIDSFNLPSIEVMKNCQFLPAAGEGYAIRYVNFGITATNVQGCPGPENFRVTTRSLFILFIFYL